MEIRDRFEGLDLIDRMPEELWTEICDTVQETGMKTIPKKKKRKKAKWLSYKALERAVKRRETKSKGEKERFSHLNAEFQRIARRDKKAFFSNQCKEIEENNRMGKTGDLFKKIRDTKATFHAMMGSIKDRSGMDLTEAEGIKKRWQEYTEELYKKDLHDPDNHNGVITHHEFFYYLHIFFFEVTLLCPFYKLDSLFCIQALCGYMFCEYFLPSLWIVNFLSLAVSFHEQTLNFDNV